MSRTDFDFWFVRKCACCRIPIKSGALCENCLKLVKRNELMCCELCGRSFSDCVCTNKKLPYTGIKSPFMLNCRAVRALIYKLKQRGEYNTVLFLAENIVAELPEIYFDFVTYVPMKISAAKLKGFDHAAVLAKCVARLINAKFRKPPFRKISLQKQKYKTASERKRAAKPFVLHGKISGTVLLVDDVTTTGTTFKACSELLKKAGADKVYCIAAAYSFDK